jgi:hypothetical protein
MQKICGKVSTLIITTLEGAQNGLSSVFNTLQNNVLIDDSMYSQVKEYSYEL